MAKCKTRRKARVRLVLGIEFGNSDEGKLESAAEVLEEGGFVGNQLRVQEGVDQASARFGSVLQRLGKCITIRAAAGTSGIKEQFFDGLVRNGGHRLKAGLTTPASVEALRTDLSSVETGCSISRSGSCGKTSAASILTSVRLFSCPLVVMASELSCGSSWF